MERNGYYSMDRLEQIEKKYGPRIYGNDWLIPEVMLTFSDAKWLVAEVKRLRNQAWGLVGAAERMLDEGYDSDRAIPKQILNEEASKMRLLLTQPSDER